MKRFEQPTGFKHLIYVIRRSRLMRTSVVAIAGAAWFLISNHCALAAFEGRQSVSTHASCHGSASAPTKIPVKGEQAPCCKVLRATIAKDGALVANNAPMSSLQSYFVGLIVFPEQLPWPLSFELDTGPPFSASFAESVLQRSVLAHAPPFLLS